VGKSSKASKSEVKDRRAVVEQMRREQQRAEKKRTFAIIGACSVVGLAIIGAGLYPVLKESQVASGELESIGARAAEAGCQDISTAPATGSAEHKPEGEKIFYEDAPPAFGSHYGTPAPMSRKFYTADDRPQLEYLVHNLEHGYTILWYDETVADSEDQLDEVEAIASKFPGTSKLENKFIAAPWTADDGEAFPKGTHVALTHWSVGGSQGGGDPAEQEGIWQYCEQPTGEAVASFVEDYPYSDSPEPDAL